jgi:hypothetical protein
VIPEGYEVVYPESDSSRGVVVSGGLVYSHAVEGRYEWDHGEDTANSGINLVNSVDPDDKIGIGYLFYKEPNPAYEIVEPGRILESGDIRAFDEHEANYYREKYGDGFKVFQSDELESTIHDMTDILGVDTVCEAYRIYPDDPDTVGYIIMGVPSFFNVAVREESPVYKDIDDEVLRHSVDVAKQVFESMSKPTLTKADAEKLIQEMQSL